jgi:hypothetical protein
MSRIETTFTCSLAVIALSAAAAARADELIQPAQGALTVNPVSGAVDLRVVSVDLDLLRSLRAGDVFALDLLGVDAAAEVILATPGGDGCTVIGRIIGEENDDGCFTMAMVGDAVSGWFHVPWFQHDVRLAWGGPGLHYQHRIDQAALPDCAGSPQVPARLRGRAEARPNPPAAPDGASPTDGDGGSGDLTLGGCLPLSFNYFDVMIVYSDDARAQAGGTNAIRSECANAVAQMTITYLNSSLPIRARLVHMEEVSYNESGSFEDHLERLTDPSDGILDGVHGTRDTVDADFVSLFVADSESGGLGWCMAGSDEAFCIVRWEQATSSLTLAHEVGHNLGCAHNPEDADCEPTDNGYGHNFFVDAENMWRHSVMAYSRNGSTRVGWYSNPSIFYMGEPTGTATRDNLSVIYSRRGECENFRLTRMDVWVDFAWRGSQNGSWVFPYDTAIEGVNRILPGGNGLPDLPVLRIKAGSRNETLTINKPMFIEACGGTVTIGQ